MSGPLIPQSPSPKAGASRWRPQHTPTITTWWLSLNWWPKAVNVFSDPSHLLLVTLPGSVVKAVPLLKTKQNKGFLKIVNFRVYLQAHISPMSHCTVWAFKTYVPKEHLGCVYFCLNAVFFHKRGRDFDITHKVTRVNSIRQRTFKLFPEKDHTTLPRGKVIRWNRTPKSSCLLD